jgi:elongation factor G
MLPVVNADWRSYPRASYYSPMGNAVHVISITIYPRTKADAAKLWATLSRLADEDPTLAYHLDSEPERAILGGTSEGHLEMAIDRLIRDYTHKKQTGGAGEFARVKIRFEPLPRGSGFVFGYAVSDGAVPSDYAPAVGEGVRETARRGGVRCYPTVDFKATLIGGAYHDTDSDAETFKTAGGACFRKGMAKVAPQLLEPIMKVTVLTPEEYMGDVIGDLNSRRGNISGMTQQDTMRAVDALVPLRHMLGYASRLWAMTKGRGSWTTEFDHYAPYWGGDDLDPVHPGAAMGLR